MVEEAPAGRCVPVDVTAAVGEVDVVATVDRRGGPELARTAEAAALAARLGIERMQHSLVVAEQRDPVWRDDRRGVGDRTDRKAPADATRRSDSVLRRVVGAEEDRPIGRDRRRDLDDVPRAHAPTHAAPADREQRGTRRLIDGPAARIEGRAPVARTAERDLPAQDRRAVATAEVERAQCAAHVGEVEAPAPQVYQRRGRLTVQGDAPAQPPPGVEREHALPGPRPEHRSVGKDRRDRREIDSVPAATVEGPAIAAGANVDRMQHAGVGGDVGHSAPADRRPDDYRALEPPTPQHSAALGPNGRDRAGVGGVTAEPRPWRKRRRRAGDRRQGGG